MKQLDDFISMLSGKFDNIEQFENMKAKGVSDFPYAEHVNTVCNDKVCDLPENFEGIFMIEESYYTVDQRRNASSHLFLFTQDNDHILLTSYELPKEYGKDFTYQGIDHISFTDVKESEKFTPALYQYHEGVWEGGSVSMFTPVLKFTLYERFSKEVLEVHETMEVNGKRTFGYDDPILYKRKKES